MAGFINNNIQNNLNVAKFQTNLDQIKSLENDVNARQKEKLKDASQQFEAVFVHQLLQVMDKTIKRSEFLGGGQAESMFRDMFYQEIAKDISTSEACNFGMGKQVYDQLSKQL
jgi:flagellar protein FlgJ